ncbi:UNVERIFIED_CONTAM: hypothetical protein NCL1_15866 [Trichonephila clavipes]
MKVERRLSERLLSGASNIWTSFFLSTTCTVYEYVFEQCNAQQLFRVRPKVTEKLKVRDIWGISVGVYHREQITDFVQSIPEFQECDEEDVETWIACDAEDCKFQMLNDDEIVTSVQEESDPVDDETDEDEDNHNTKVARVHQMLTRFLP